MEVPIKCDLCPATFSMKQSLKRHYENSHNLNLKDFPASFAAIKDKKTNCPYCNIAVNKLTAHILTCKSKPQQSPSPPLNLRLSISPVSEPALETAPGPDSGPFIAAIKRQPLQSSTKIDSPRVSGPSNFAKILEEFKHFMESAEGGKCKKSTKQQYCHIISKFLDYMANEKGPNTAVEIMSITLADHEQFELLPDPGDWIESTYPSNESYQSSKRLGINVFKKFCDFLIAKLNANEKNFQSFDDLTCRISHIEKRRKNADDLVNEYGKDPDLILAEDKDNDSDNDEIQGAFSITMGEPLAQKTTEEVSSQREPDPYGEKVVNWKRTDRSKIMPEERQFILQKFDQPERKSILAYEIRQALNDPNFLMIFNAIKARESCESDIYVIKIIQESYKAYKKKESKKQ